MVSLLGFLFVVALSSTALSQQHLFLQSRPACSYQWLTASHTFENTSILEVVSVPANLQFPVAGTCQSTVSSTVDICRVYGIIWTSSSSSLRFEVWLPSVDNWHGRVLSTGNGGLNGCIDYVNMDYATSLHFATIGSDAGHDGLLALPLFNRPEVIKDFSYRSVHQAAVIGKLIVEAYYAKTPSKSYYLGCSAGGRQGMQSALLYPGDFDGIVAGSPAVDWNNFMGSGGITTQYVGANVTSPDRYIPPALWNSVAREVYKQCDHLDGLADGILADPDLCDFNPDPLLCHHGGSEDCLTQAQVDGLHDLYKPIYGTKGNLLWPRFDPGSEIDTVFLIPMIGRFSPSTVEWFRNTIYNDPQHSFDKFSVSDIEYADTINPGGIATWDGDMSEFRKRGGKILTFHGTSDALIPSGNSKRFYKKVLDTLEPDGSKNLDDFYRLFMIPGMFHCQTSGAWAFGQGALSGSATNRINDTAHNILLALVDWVEGGVAPENITGVGDRFEERMHCRYPLASVWKDTKWTCQKT